MKRWRWLLAMAWVLATVPAVAEEPKESEVAELKAQVQQLSAELVRTQEELSVLRRKVEPQLKTVTYNLHDLVKVMPAKGGKVDVELKPWITLIEQTISPASWQTFGGEGKIAEFKSNVSIVVTQTPAVHEQIAEFLAETRDMKKRLEKSGLSVQITPAPQDLVEQLGAAKR